jgi:excisionase family DNA binding protein
MAKKNPLEADVISARQAAAIVGCGVRTVQRLAQKGEIEAARLPGPNGQYVFSKKAVEAYRAELQKRWEAEYE